MKLDDIKKHIRDFFRGNDSEEGRRMIDLWYHFFDDKSDELEELDIEEKEILRKNIFHEIRNAAGIGDKKIYRIQHGVSAHNRTWPYKMAAGFAVLLLALIPVFLMTTEQPVPEAVVYRTSSNPAGQSSRITLSDGSTIWLSANSTLEYPEKFDGEYREVILQGEAFFDVVSNPNQPFVVKSGDLQTRVLGTSFNIRAFEDEEDIKITVVTGRVSIEQTATTDNTDAPQSVAFLYPEQQLVYNNSTGKSMTQQVDSRLFTSWKDGVLMFENHTFEEIVSRLERWYGVEIQFTDPEVKEIRFRILFENTSLEHALRMLQAIEDFEFEMEGGQIWIR